MKSNKLVSYLLAAMVAVLFLSGAVVTVRAQSKHGAAVTMTEDQSAYTLSNGIVNVRVDKRSGDLLSMQFDGMEMLATILRPDGLTGCGSGQAGRKSSRRRRRLHGPSIRILVARYGGAAYGRQGDH